MPCLGFMITVCMELHMLCGFPLDPLVSSRLPKNMPEGSMLNCPICECVHFAINRVYSHLVPTVPKIDSGGTGKSKME